MGRMNEADTVSKLRYSVQVCAPLSEGHHWPVRYGSEDEAIESARSQVGPNVGERHPSTLVGGS